MQGSFLNWSATVLLLAGAPTRAGVLRVSILDENEKPVAARVYLTDPRGEPVFPPNTLRYEKVRPDGIAERHFVPAGGSFMAELPAGLYRLYVERGKEYWPETLRVAIPDSGEASHTVRLRRWVDMNRRGWFSGDMHVHRGLSSMSVLMEAEDLTIAVPISLWKTNQSQYRDPDLNNFLATADSDGVFHADTQRFFPVLNEELEPRASALLASWLGRSPIALDYPMARFGSAVRQAHGVSDSEKPTSLELPALAAAGALDTVGLVNNHIWRAGSYTAAWGAWPARMLGRYPETCTGFVQSGYEMYSALLNAGFDLKLSAGSASGVHPVPPGWSRIYVRTGGSISPIAWFDALKAGRSFVTTGPMLLLTVNGSGPGDPIRNQRFPAMLDIGVEMLSIRDVAAAEVVVNGVVHTVRLAKDAPGSHSYRGALRISVESSSWIVARWVGERGGTCDAAHTSPVYIWKGSNPVPLSRRDVEMLAERVESLLGDVKSGRNLQGNIVLDSDQLRAATLQYLEKALDVYRTKVRNHNH